MHPGKHIKRMRSALDLTQQELGESIGLPESSAQKIISRWECGRCNPDLESLAALYRVLGGDLMDYLPMERRSPWKGRDLNVRVEPKTNTGRKIRERRDALGWTQSRLAYVLGITKEKVSAWECTEALPDLVAFRRIVDVLGGNPEDYLP